MMLIPAHREPFPAEGSVFQTDLPESRPEDKDLHKYDLLREALGNTGRRKGRSQKECVSSAQGYKVPCHVGAKDGTGWFLQELVCV